MPAPSNKTPRQRTRLMLILGFGSLLVLMAMVGFNSIRTLRHIEDRNRQITQSYLERHQRLDQIRFELYSSWTLVRDYMLEPNDVAAEQQLSNLREVQKEMDANLQDYSNSLISEEQQLFADLKLELTAYWKTLEPVFNWSADQRRFLGTHFLRQEIFPRRSTMLKIATQMDEINRRALNDGEGRLADLFASFRNRITLLLGITLSIGVILAGISTANILRLERISERHYQETLQIQAELKKLSARLVAAQEQERRSISRELHDEIGQSLSAILVDLGNLSSFLPPEQKEARQISSAIKVLAENTLGTIRNMALLLRPSMLDDFGLIPALHWLARELSRRTGLPVKVIAEELPDTLTEEQKTCIFRVTQEALNNIARHAEAASASVRVEQAPDLLKLTIQDDGVGFDPIKTRGMGLVGMEERVRNLHGVMQMESKIGNGTIIKIELPLNLPKEKVKYE